MYTAKEYDASAADIWSLAIIYCCMTLRRFPWKIPQNTDNSWKLFAAEPTPGHDPVKLVHPSRRPGEPNPEEELKKENHQSHKRHESTATVGAEEASKEAAKEKETSSQAPTETTNVEGERKTTIRGPWRILRLLPRESRYIIWRMLDINPKTRATMDEILAEPWVGDSLMCQQTDAGEVMHAEDHTHVLQPPNSPAPAT